MFSRHMIYVISFSFFFMVLFGCAAGRKETTPIKEDIGYEIRETPQEKHEGSLWEENGPLSELFINPKARNVGDIITVSIVESASASNNASTETSRDSSLQGGIDNLFNMEKRYPSAHPFFNPFNYSSRAAVKGGLKSDFKGDGTTTRNGSLTAYITARVTDVLPNGNLKIVGTREVAVNGETQIITLSGIVRPRDVSPDNTVQSTYICDARITYSGTGIINDRQRPGWLANLLNKAWPF